MDTNILIDEPPSRDTMPLSPGKKFHIFVSYRDVSRDKLWVKKVIGKLETEYGYICCDHERYSLPGTNVIDNIKYGVKNSEKVVVVFSKEAIDSHHVSQKENSAYIESFETRKSILIPVLLDDCDVPEEFMHVTYIDAREGVEETTWWPKLIKSIQSTGLFKQIVICSSTEVAGIKEYFHCARIQSLSLEIVLFVREAPKPPFYVEGKNVAAGKTFAITQLCSIETKHNYFRWSMQINPKDVPAKWQPQAFGVPVDLIRATYKNLLRSPRVVCRQQLCLLASFCVLIGCEIFAFFLYYFIHGIYYITQPKEFIPYVIACIFLLSLLGNCYFPYKLIYVKTPNSIRYKIIDYNRILSKYEVLLTVVHGYMWNTASEYVIRHLLKEGITHTTEYRDIPYSDRMMASTDSTSLLSGVGKPSRSREAVDSSRQHAHAASQTYMNSCYLDIENKSHDCETKFNEKEDTENKAMEFLMWYTPEYLNLAYTNKLKNPKEDRHGIKLKCLCQYLEEADEDFREIVKRTKS